MTMRRIGLIALLLMLTTLPGFAAGGATGLDALEVQVFGKKLGGPSVEARLARLERAFSVHSNPKLSASYRLSRLMNLQEKTSASQRHNLAVQAYNRGIDETQKGFSENAIISYRQAIQFDPGLIQAYNNLANLLLQKNLFDETVDLYKHGIRLRPNEPLLHRNLGVLYEKLGKIQEAVAEYEIYLKNTKQPDPPIKAIVDNYRANRKLGAGSPDYLAATTQSSEGRQLIWPQKLNPIKVFVKTTGLEQNFALPLIHMSLREWERATEGRLRFELIGTPEAANIVITLREGPLSDPVEDIGHTEYLMAESQFRRQQLNFVTITLNTGDPQTIKTLPPESRSEQIYRLSLHEVGHAVGIWGHSPDPADIMFTHPITSGLSSRDIRTVQLMYGLDSKNSKNAMAPSAGSRFPR
jgi:predicted Zn-dependent protease